MPEVTDKIIWRAPVMTNDAAGGRVTCTSYRAARATADFDEISRGHCEEPETMKQSGAEEPHKGQGGS
jgi:hypothetical protein